MKRIEIVVSPKGESQVETKGFNGSRCREASKFIESALGKQKVEMLKPEFHIQTPSENLVENSN